MSCLDFQENGSRTLFTDVQFPVTGISMDRCSPTTPISPLYIQWTEKEKQVKRFFCQEFGVPERLTMDGAKEQIGSNSEFMHQIWKNDIDFHFIEPERHNQNLAEGVIREIHWNCFRVMFRKKVPKKFLNYGMRWVCEIQQRTHLFSNRIDGGIPLEKLTGETQDISEYLDFGFYDRVWYH